jgi:putative ABC transport system permease protein
VPLRRGRFFSSSDTPDTPPRVLINEAFVARFMKERDPLSTRFRVHGRGGPGPWNDVVGVVGDVKNAGLAAPIRPEVFIPMEQMRDGWNQLFLLVRTGGEPSAFLPQVRSVVASLDPEQPIYAIQTMEEAVSTSVFQQRIAAGLIGVFAVVAMIMSAIGIYGVMSYAVSARTQEIGIRMAIGAERSDVLRLVLAQVLRMTVIGLAIGVALLLLAGKALSDLLYGVTPADPATIAVVTILLGTVALLAGWIPAYRASRVNPIIALRYE